MFHTLPPSQESTMNLLTSPFDPNQLQYVLDNELQYPPHSQPVDVPSNHHSNNFMFNSMSLPNNLSPLQSFRDRTSSPELDMVRSIRTYYLKYPFLIWRFILTFNFF
jgi:hypothetical protein